jgi:hypothetical protein
MENILEIYEEFGDYGTPNAIYLITKQMNGDVE